MARENKPDETPVAEPTMASVMAELVKLQRESQGVQKEQLRQTRRRSNQSGALRSPFNPRGDKDFPMAELKCEMWIPYKITNAHLGGLDREEVDLLNLLEPGEYRIEMNDDSMQTVCVVGTKNSDTGQLYKLEMKGPMDEDGKHTGLFTKDRLQRFPSMKSILRQCIGDAAEAVLPMKEELRRIRLPETDPQHLAVSIGE